MQLTPAQTLYYLLLHNLYELVPCVLLLIAWFAVSRYNRTRTRRVSYAAVASALCGLLNPAWVSLVFFRLQVLRIARGDDEVRSFAFGFAALVLGVVALVLIRRSRGSLDGVYFAVVGVLFGGYWTFVWARMFFLFSSYLWQMRGGHGP